VIWLMVKFVYGLWTNKSVLIIILNETYDFMNKVNDDNLVVKGFLKITKRLRKGKDKWLEVNALCFKKVLETKTLAKCKCRSKSDDKLLKIKAFRQNKRQWITLI